jgi:glutaminyl-tRNA synthetase
MHQKGKLLEPYIWVSIAHAVPQVRVYDHLFIDEAPDGHRRKNFLDFMNTNSLKIVTGYVEPSLKIVAVDDKFQFQRLGGLFQCRCHTCR